MGSSIPESSADDNTGCLVANARQLLQILKGLGHSAVMVIYKHLAKSTQVSSLLQGQCRGK